MFENALTSEQISLAEKLFPELEGFFFAGGTALALQIGHRRSVDLDLASNTPINPFNLERKMIGGKFEIQSVFTATADEFSILIDSVRVTFFFFPFEAQHNIRWERCRIALPGVVELAAMKANALGRRNQWKDYVDLYFLLKSHLSVEDIASKASEIFSKHFNAKLFREQLCFFDNINDSDTIDYIDHVPDNEEIKTFLETIAISI